MTGSVSGFPERSAVLRFVRAAVENARDLADAADVLMGCSHWPRAYGLAVLAFEELGKAGLGFTVLMMPEQARAEVSWADLRWHLPKLMVARFHLLVLAPLFDGGPAPVRLAEILGGLEEAARAESEGKQRGFYVDLSDDGTLRRPSDLGEQEAARVVADVRELLGHVPHLTDAGFHEWLAGGLSAEAAEAVEWAGGVAGQMEEVYAETGDDAAAWTTLFDAVRQLRQGSEPLEPGGGA